MEQKYILSIVALGIIAILGVSMVSAFGFGNKFMNSELTDEEKTALEEQRQAMQNAIENNDFAAWKALREERIAEMQQSLTQENFNKQVERHTQMSEFRAAMEEARESGDFSKVEELKEEYGIEGKGFGKRNCPSAE